MRRSRRSSAERAVRDSAGARPRRATTRRAGGSSHRVARALLMAEPPSIDAGEITDKGYINQRAVLERRARSSSGSIGRVPIPR